jgi:uncharacterized protein YgbK (DUF1537 family)
MLAELPPEWPEDLLPAIQQQVRASDRTVIVLDDDPTGTQTVHGVRVRSDWPVERLVEEFMAGSPALYLLTNSRSLAQDSAAALNREIGENLSAASRIAKRDFAVISRSDSTLRGHFPREVTALAESLGQSHAFDAWVLVPFFLEGGRYTIDDVHYVAENERLVPAGETQFARDKAFGYQSSNLRAWVEEKTGGKISADRVASISISSLRQGGPREVTRQLLGLPRGAVCIANAASYRDLEVLVLGLLSAEAQGRRYLYRTAASFVRVRAGIAPRPLLSRADLHLPAQGAGLVIAGSYVARTTAQIDALLRETGICRVEVQVNALLDQSTREAELARSGQAANRLLAAGHDVLIYTSRELISTADAEGSLAIGRVVSEGLVSLVRGLETRPRYLLAKGGITSSDIATRGLGIHRALVLGQILPGVPVWQAGPESRFPGLDVIIFPGNVGEPDAMVQIVRALG